MKDRYADDWEALARTEPYFAVLTDEGFLGVAGNSAATKAFFDTGEDDVAALFASIESLTAHPLRPRATLDFGCGVGRLTLPLARRSVRVVGCDIAPTMLKHAARNATDAGLQNVELIETSDLAQLPDATFDFICSLLVMQHIPPTIGYPLVRTMLRLLAPGGIAAVHLTFERPGGRLRRFARAMRGRSRFVHRVAAAVRSEPHRLPYMQMNEYDSEVVSRDIAAAGAELVARFPTRHGDTSGAVLVIRK